MQRVVPRTQTLARKHELRPRQRTRDRSELLLHDVPLHEHPREYAQRECHQGYAKEAVESAEERGPGRQYARGGIDGRGGQASRRQCRDCEVSGGDGIPSLIDDAPRYAHSDPQYEDEVYPMVFVGEERVCSVPRACEDGPREGTVVYEARRW